MTRQPVPAVLNPTNTRRANNLLQVLRRTAHGFTNPRNFEARGILIT